MTQLPDYTINVVVGDADADELTRTRAVLLQGPKIRVTGTARAHAEVLALAELEPDIFLLSTNLDPAGMPALINQVLDVAPASQVILVTDFGDPLDIGQAMVAGARGLVRKPLAAHDVVGTIQRLFENELNRRQRADEMARQRRVQAANGRVIVVFSPKGGVGCTLLACNLALALQSATQKRVALVDYSLQFGSVGALLNQQAAHTVAELASRQEEIDGAILDDVTVTHPSGVRVLLRPNSLQEMEQITTEGLVAVLDGARKSFDYVVVDTWHVVEPSTLAVLEMADRLLLVTTPEVPALNAMRHFLDILKAYPHLRDKPQLLVNRQPSTGEVSLKYVEEALGMKAVATVPSDGQMLTLAINEGTPLLQQKHANRPFVRNLNKLAESLAVQTDLAGANAGTGAASRRFILSRRQNYS
jgi:pilus assembly protein CpaE